MVNKANIQKVIDTISSVTPGRFKMETWVQGGYPRSKETIHTCGTAACIGGWTNILERIENPSHEANSNSAARFLGIIDNQEITSQLFTPSGWSSGKLTQAQGVRVLEILRDEEIIDWPRAIREIAKGIPHKQPIDDLAARADAALAKIASADLSPVSALPQPEQKGKLSIRS